MFTYWRLDNIKVLATALLQNYKSQLFIEYCSGSNKKKWLLKDFTLNEGSSRHAFMDNDFFSLFFRKVNLKCWETLQKCTKFEDCFSQLGGEWDLSGSLFNEEEYLCNLYG